MRKIGINIYMLMRDVGLSPEILAENLGYSYRDIYRVIEGRVMLPPSELERIANILGKTKKELIHYEVNEYPAELRYVEKFSNQDNLNIVLDLFDEYVELVEAMTTNDVGYDRR